MALAVASTSTASANNASSVVITKPTGVQVGDLLIASVAGNATGTISGFTVGQTESYNGPASFDVSVSLLWKIADASDVSASNYTVSGSAGTLGSVSMIRVTGWTTGDPFFTKDTLTTSHDGDLVINESVSYLRPFQQLLLITGCSLSAENYSDYSAYQISSSDSNPSWIEVAENDFLTQSSANWHSHFLAYAVSTNTSVITNWGLNITASGVGGPDQEVMIFAISVSPQTVIADVDRVDTPPTLFGVTASEVTVSADIDHLADTTEVHAIPTKDSSTNTQWTNETKPTSTWTNEQKI